MWKIMTTTTVEFYWRANGAEGEWYATAGDIESDVIDNNRAV